MTTVKFRSRVRVKSAWEREKQFPPGIKNISSKKKVDCLTKGKNKVCHPPRRQREGKTLGQERR